MSFILGLIIGLVIGWMIPRPQWADDAWQWIKSKFSRTPVA